MTLDSSTEPAPPVAAVFTIFVGVHSCIYALISASGPHLDRQFGIALPHSRGAAELRKWPPILSVPVASLSFRNCPGVREPRLGSGRIRSLSLSLSFARAQVFLDFNSLRDI